MNIKVYQAITAVQAALAAQGIAKGHKNAQQGYSFRGIDDVYGVLSQLLSANNLCCLPRIIERHCEERQSKKGDPIFSVSVRAEFDFVSSEDGSKHTVATFGEAMDSADKATNKAMSAAYKYMAFMSFSIPVQGEDDADLSTPDAGYKKPVQQSQTYQKPQNKASEKPKEIVDSALVKQEKIKIAALSDQRQFLEYFDQLASIKPLCKENESKIIWSAYTKRAEEFNLIWDKADGTFVTFYPDALPGDVQQAATH